MKNKKFIPQLDQRHDSTSLKTETIQGRVDHVNRKFAYITETGLASDVIVKTEMLGNAIHRDFVTVTLTKKQSKSSQEHPEGKVTGLVKRHKDEFVGRVKMVKGYISVIPDNRHLYLQFFIDAKNSTKVSNNDKVLVKVKEWHSTFMSNPTAEIITKLGKSGENDAEIHSIMSEFDLPFNFTEQVTKAANNIDNVIDKKEITLRRDFREDTTFTIDPKDAKDFDDALSLKKIGEHRYEVGIHIADVSHYVQKESTLDKEAIKRATSVYLVDRTIPMLPERISNELCSLRPHEDKLTFSAVFEVDLDGNIHKQWFGKTIIHSDKRFTYEDVQETLEGREELFKTELTTLNCIAQKLKEKRFKSGAINFETTEIKFELDELKRPIGVIQKIRKDAHFLVEEWMLLANKSVAEFVFNIDNPEKKDKLSKTFLYRIHDDPSPEKLSNFKSFASTLGHRIGEGNISKGLNRLFENLSGKPEQNVLETLAIRTMAKAVYSTEPKKHFGLAFKHYTHFTSPIRRYPDVLVHRVLQEYLTNKNKEINKSPLESLCKHSSAQEKLAADAERASIKFKQVEYAQALVGQKFEGIVSGVTEWGIFVEIIENKCEGMIRLKDFNDDYYYYDEKNYCIIGRKKKRKWTMGDKMNVVITATDVGKRTIDLRPSYLL